MNGTLRKAILVLVVIAGIGLGRWLGYSWAIAIVFGTGLFLVADAFSRPRGGAPAPPQE